MLSWWNLSSSTAYPCPSINYLNRNHYGKALSSPTIVASVELLPFLFCFRDRSIIYTDPMDIISPFSPFQSGYAAKDASTHHFMKLGLSALSMSGRCRVPLMYLINLTSFPLSYSFVILTKVHRKSMVILMSFMALDMKNRSCATVWWNAVSCYSFSSVCSFSGLT